jgi:hypothetical protein
MRGLIPLCFLCPQLASRTSRRFDNSLSSAFYSSGTRFSPRFLLAAVFAALPVSPGSLHKLYVSYVRKTNIRDDLMRDGAKLRRFCHGVFLQCKNICAISPVTTRGHHSKGCGLDRTEAVLWYVPPIRQLAIEQTHGEYAWIAAN